MKNLKGGGSQRKIPDEGRKSKAARDRAVFLDLNFLNLKQWLSSIQPGCLVNCGHSSECARHCNCKPCCPSRNTTPLGFRVFIWYSGHPGSNPRQFLHGDGVRLRQGRRESTSSPAHGWVYGTTEFQVWFLPRLVLLMAIVLDFLESI